MSSVQVIEVETVSQTLIVALLGNPNCGKTTLFNALTGLRQKVGNYPGVTVDRKEGRSSLPDGRSALILDLPGLYSLTPHSPDELIAREVLMGLRKDTPKPDVILNVVDASNLERNLYLTSQLIDTGIPVVIALTMTDTLGKDGREIHASVLEDAIGIPVKIVVASQRAGIAQLQAALASASTRSIPEPAWTVPREIYEGISSLQSALEREHELTSRPAFSEAVTLLMQDNDLAPLEKLSHPTRKLVRTTKERLAASEIDFAATVIESRYEWIGKVCEGVIYDSNAIRKQPISTNERVDRLLMHPVWGYVIFFFVMSLIFQLVFTMGQAPANWVQSQVSRVGGNLTRLMPSGDLRALLDDGVLGGVGTLLSFLPEILLLFFFISLLEDTGYLARAAFLMDKLMSKVGLHGKSFIPLLSSFACAIPGIMATRTIGDRKARLITILVAPLMSCSARLPVYLLMTTSFVPNIRVAGVGGITLLTLQGAVFISMYFLGMIVAFSIAWLFHRTLLKGVSPTFLLELPPYRLPGIRATVMQMLERAGLFVKQAGTIILAASIVVWFLSSYPKHPNLPPGQALELSYLGHIGKIIEPAIHPLGFDWKMGVGIASSFVAREVFVSTMATVYDVGEPDSMAGKANLGKKMQQDTYPGTGKRVYTPLVAVCLMIYYVLAMQCMSTVAVVRRETGGWKWPIFQIAYMTGTAWLITFVVYQIGHHLGWG